MAPLQWDCRWNNHGPSSSTRPVCLDRPAPPVGCISKAPGGVGLAKSIARENRAAPHRWPRDAALRHRRSSLAGRDRCAPHRRPRCTCAQVSGLRLSDTRPDRHDATVRGLCAGDPLGRGGRRQRADADLLMCGRRPIGAFDHRPLGPRSRNQSDAHRAGRRIARGVARLVRAGSPRADGCDPAAPGFGQGGSAVSTGHHRRRSRPDRPGHEGRCGARRCRT